MCVPYYYVVRLEAGYDFYTNYDSQKGLDLADNPYAELLFYWPEQDARFVSVAALKKSRLEESTDYYHKRPRRQPRLQRISVRHKAV